MKKWFLILLVMLLSVFMTACIKVEFVKPGEQEVPVQEESVQVETPQETGEETLLQTETAQEPVEETLVQEETESIEKIPEEDEQAESTQVAEEEDLWENCIGLWSTNPGVQTDPAAAYHNYYVCLFENGTAVRFGWRLMDVGTWLGVPNTNRVLVSYSVGCSSGAFEGWTAGDGDDMVSYEHDKDTDTLRWIASTAEELDPTGYPWEKTYYPANRADAYETCARYLSYLEDITWETGVWFVKKEQTEELKTKLKDGLQAMSGISAQMKNYADVDLTKGYWYQFSSQTANCYEYQFFADGTVRVRECDVMMNDGAYLDEIYPESEMYAVKEMVYQVTDYGKVVVGGTEMFMAPTFGQLVYSFTVPWSEGKVLSGYLKQFDHKLSVAEMKKEARAFTWDFWNENIITLDE